MLGELYLTIQINFQDILTICCCQPRSLTEKCVGGEGVSPLCYYREPCQDANIQEGTQHASHAYKCNFSFESCRDHLKIIKWRKIREQKYDKTFRSAVEDTIFKKLVKVQNHLMPNVAKSVNSIKTKRSLKQ